MEGTWFAVVACALLGGAGGCAAYEMLVRAWLRERRGTAGRAAAMPEGSGRASSGKAGRAVARSGAMRERAARTARSDLRGRAARALGAATRRIERLLPMARADGDAYRALIVRAGWALEPETLRALRVLSAAAGAALAFLAGALSGCVEPVAACGLVAAGAVAGWSAPRLAIARAATRRRRVLEAQLPDAMELLGIAIAAGSPVEQCFREVAGTVGQPLSGEFETVDREVNLLGHSREEALGHLSDRCESRDVSAFVAQLSQAVSQGSSIAEGLSSQAALARETAQADALERIRKMPTKLDVILSFCFLPPTIALVVVPTVVDLLKFLNDTLQ